MSPWSTETEALEKTPLLDYERCGRHDKNYTTLKGIRRHSPNPSMNSQLESGPSCSRSLIYRRCFSAETLLSSSANRESSERTSSDSPNFQCIYSQQNQEQNQPLLSRSGPFCKVRKWVELRLENSGSVARDHLASERTFLAYVRTSLAIASSGVGESPLFSFRAYCGLTIPFSTCTALFYRLSNIMAETSPLHSSIGCSYSYPRPLGLIHRFVVIKFMQR